MRDYQKHRVYNFDWALEDEIWNPKLSKKRAFKLICNIFDDYCYTKPWSLTFYDEYSEDGKDLIATAFNSWGTSTAINIPKEMLNRACVLHEVAHALAGRRTNHGPKFVSIFMDLLERYSFVDRELLILRAKQCKVNYQYYKAKPRPTKKNRQPYLKAA